MKKFYAIHSDISDERPTRSKAKGTRLERRIRDWYAQAGFTVFRVAGSFGPVDLLALHPYKLDLVQVKANRWCGPQERQALAALEASLPRCRDCGDRVAEIVQVRWDDYAREPKLQAYRGHQWQRIDGGSHEN